MIAYLIDCLDPMYPIDMYPLLIMDSTRIQVRQEALSPAMTPKQLQSLWLKHRPKQLLIPSTFLGPEKITSSTVELFSQIMNVGIYSVVDGEMMKVQASSEWYAGEVDFHVRLNTIIELLFLKQTKHILFIA
jgi:hypothetical protein